MIRRILIANVFLLIFSGIAEKVSGAIPVANFSVDFRSVCEGQCVNFTDLSTNAPTSWSWSFQGASVQTSTQQNPSNICYNTAGTYFVSLTVTNASGSNTLYIPGYITVYPSSVVNLLPNGDFNNYNTAFTTQLVYVPVGALSPNQCSIDTNAWYHNGNWAALSPDSSPFFMSDGNTVSGTIVWSETLSNVFPSSAYTFSFLMTNLDVNHTFVCPELMTTVTDQSGTVLISGTTGLLPAANSNNPPVFVWTPFDYVFSTLANTTSITITVSQVGGVYLGFDFALEDMNLKTHFCDSIAAVPVAGLYTDGSLLCPGSCADFLNLSVNGNTYQWFFPGGMPSSSTSVNPQSICYNTPGSYDVTLIAMNGNQADTILLQGLVQVLPYPPPQGITQSGDTLFAIPGSVSYQWYTDGNMIPGATDYFYVADHIGNYNVVATDSNNCEVEAVIFDVVAGVQLAAGNSQLVIFPDPAEEKLYVNRDILNEAAPEISVYNVMGEKVMTVWPAASSHRETVLDVSNLSPGVYFLEVTSGEKSFKTKFIKQ